MDLALQLWHLCQPLLQQIDQNNAAVPAPRIACLVGTNEDKVLAGAVHRDIRGVTPGKQLALLEHAVLQHLQIPCRSAPVAKPQCAAVWKAQRMKDGNVDVRGLRSQPFLQSPVRCCVLASPTPLRRLQRRGVDDDMIDDGEAAPQLAGQGRSAALWPGEAEVGGVEAIHFTEGFDADFSFVVGHSELAEAMETSLHGEEGRRAVWGVSNICR